MIVDEIAAGSGRENVMGEVKLMTRDVIYGTLLFALLLQVPAQRIIGCVEHPGRHYGCVEHSGRYYILL